MLPRRGTVSTPFRSSVRALEDLVKKTAAAFAATAFGAVSGGVLVGSPAQAMPSDLCDAYTDHEITDDGSLDADWYMECVPQFGAGKVEFTIASDMDFPPGYVADLTDPAVTAETNLDVGSATEYGLTPEHGAFQDIRIAEERSDATDYEGSMVAPITRVRSVAVSALPEACDGEDYANAYRVDYGSVSTTFTQDIDGEPVSTEIDVTPAPLFLGFTADPDEGQAEYAEAVCAASEDGGLVGLPGEEITVIEEVVDRERVLDEFITNTVQGDVPLTLGFGPSEETVALRLGTFELGVVGDDAPGEEPGDEDGGGDEDGAGAGDEDGAGDVDDALLPDTGAGASAPADEGTVPAGAWAVVGTLVAGGLALVGVRRRAIRRG
jgi:hypothetical protein